MRSVDSLVHYNQRFKKFREEAERLCQHMTHEERDAWAHTNASDHPGFHDASTHDPAKRRHQPKKGLVSLELVRTILQVLMFLILVRGTLHCQDQTRTVIQHGAIVAGDCTKWFATGQIQDAGAACGSGGGGSSAWDAITNPTAGGLTLTQFANGNDFWIVKRKTDTTPTGTFARFQTNAATDLFRINIDGSTGIGANPTTKLDVRGKINLDNGSADAILTTNGATTQVFRGLASTTWNDNVAALFFQVGDTNNPNALFTSSIGNDFGRFGIGTTHLTIGPSAGSYPTPTGLVELSNDFGNGAARPILNLYENRSQSADAIDIYSAAIAPAIGSLIWSVDVNGNQKANAYQTDNNCSSSASPAVCGSAAAGSVAVPTGTNPTLTVNTTVVTANSQIMVQQDDTLGTKLSVTCNSTLGVLATEPVVTARTAATSFQITISGVVTTNPVCLSYVIVN